jgi:hypothetical protein
MTTKSKCVQSTFKLALLTWIIIWSQIKVSRTTNYKSLSSQLLSVNCPATGWSTRVRYVTGAGLFSLPYLDWLRYPPSLLSSVHRELSPGGRGKATCVSAQVAPVLYRGLNEWSFICTSSIRLHDMLSRLKGNFAVIFVLLCVSWKLILTDSYRMEWKIPYIFLKDDSSK